MSRRLSAREMYRRFTRLELKQADEIATSVRRYLVGNAVADVARLTAMPVSLVQKLRSGEVASLVDVIYWQRKQREAAQ